MFIRVNQRLAFSHEGRTFETLGPKDGVHEVPNWVEEDPFFQENLKLGNIEMIVTVGVEPPVTKTENPVVTSSVPAVKTEVKLPETK